MEVADLKAKSRQKAGKGVCHSLRNHGEIPGIMYGRGTNNLLVEFSEMELNDILKSQGEHGVINVDVNGQKVKTMIKEVQRDPVNRKLMHVDLKYIKDDEKVHTDIPIMIKGEGAVRSKGGVVQQQLGLVSIETTPDKLPKYILADVSKLNVGEKLTIADVEFSSDITVVTDIASVIASITSAKENEENLDSDEQIALDNVSFRTKEIE